MTTSPSVTGLSSPVGREQVPVGTFGYFQARNKRNAYNLVIEEFLASGLSQADLAGRLGKGTDVVCRLLAAPGNWTLNTISDFLFAISGAAPVFDVEYPLSRPSRNRVGPEWLYDDGQEMVGSPSTQRVDTTGRELNVNSTEAISVSLGSS